VSVNRPYQYVDKLRSFRLSQLWLRKYISEDARYLVIRAKVELLNGNETDVSKDSKYELKQAEESK
jgi:hypothetical protein